jgi:hypothetical protein
MRKEREREVEKEEDGIGGDEAKGISLCAMERGTLFRKIVIR